MKILFLTEEEEQEFRHLCFQDEVFPLLSAPIKVLKPNYTQHSPTEIWLATTLLTLRLITEEEPEEMEDEIDTCAHQGCDGFLLLFVAMMQLSAMRKTVSQAAEIIRTIQRHIQQYELYAPLFAAVKSKEKQRREKWGMEVNLDHYHPVVVDVNAHQAPSGCKNATSGKEDSGREIIKLLVDIAIKHGDTEMCDKLEFLLQRLNLQHGYCFREEIERLGKSTDKANEQAHKPGVNANKYYGAGSVHEDYSRQMYVEPTNNTTRRIENR